MPASPYSAIPSPIIRAGSCSVCRRNSAMMKFPSSLSRSERTSFALTSTRRTHTAVIRTGVVQGDLWQRRLRPQRPDSQRLLYLHQQVEHAPWTGYIDNIRLGVNPDANFNHDTQIDGVDLGIWKTSFGGGAGGDADHDSDTDGADFLVWQRQFGPVAGVATASRTGLDRPGRRLSARSGVQSPLPT